jgi:hypothetical protein
MILILEAVTIIVFATVWEEGGDANVNPAPKTSVSMKLTRKDIMKPVIYG